MLASRRTLPRVTPSASNRLEASPPQGGEKMNAHNSSTALAGEVAGHRT